MLRQINDFQRCSVCHNGLGASRCEACHYTGFMTKGGLPASVVLGENTVWQKKELKKKKEVEKLAKKSAKRPSWFKSEKRN